MVKREENLPMPAPRRPCTHHPPLPTPACTSSDVVFRLPAHPGQLGAHAAHCATHCDRLQVPDGQWGVKEGVHLALQLDVLLACQQSASCI